MAFNTVPELIKDLQKGKMVIVIDDENRENEGDLVLPTDFVSAGAINFMSLSARGLICVAITFEQAERLKLPLMVNPEKNLSPNKTAFTVSVESATGISTGISSADRACTIKAVANPLAVPEDIITPGHVFPIRAHKGGVLKRAGHTEASVDLCRLAQLQPSAVICEIINPDGSMARTPDLKKFATKHKIKIGTIEDLIRYRITYESFVEEKACRPFMGAGLFEGDFIGPEWVSKTGVATKPVDRPLELKAENRGEAKFPQRPAGPPRQNPRGGQNPRGEFRLPRGFRLPRAQRWILRVFRDKIHHREHLVFSKGDISDGKPVLTRVHVSCVIGDIFGGPFSQSGLDLRRAIDKINQEGRGVLVYLCMENEENRLTNHVQSLPSKDYVSPSLAGQTQRNITSRAKNGAPSNDPLCGPAPALATGAMDEKDYGVGAQILRALQVRQLRLLSHSPKKRVGLKGYGLEIIEMVSLKGSTDNKKRTKV